MRRISRKRQAQLEEYAVLRAAYLYAHPACVRCGGPATEIHHAKGREGRRLLIVRFWLGVCSSCHVWITAHPHEAAEAGLKETKWR